MRLVPTALAEVHVVESPVYADDRGFFTEVFRANEFARLGLPTVYEQDNHSHSTLYTLRGLHFQLNRPQGKLIRVITGKIFDVAVDIRRSSPMFGKWVGVTLEAGDGRQLWVPPGFAHGFVVLSDLADVSYKCTTAYDAASDRGISCNDPQIGIEWPLPFGIQARLSAKDVAAPMLAAAELFK